MWRLQSIEADIHNVMVFSSSTEGTEEQTQSSRRHYSLFFCSWKLGAIRGGVFVRSFPVFFLSSYLPTSTCFHVPPILNKKNKKTSMDSLFHSAGKDVNQSVAASRVKEKLSTRNRTPFLRLFKIMVTQKAILYKRKASLFLQ